MTDDSRRAFALEVVARLRAAGQEAYWAGGCVRDLLMGIEPADYDVATSARPEHVMTLFRRTVPVGVSFGVVRVLGPEGAGEVEVATFRSDGVYLDGRRPDSVAFSTAEFDASRRDFTINGMFLDPTDGRVLDYVGGRADLDAGVLRAIGDPSSRFAEDKLRLLRAVRFAARFGLAIEAETKAALVAMAGQVTAVAVERIAQELKKMLIDRSRSTAIRLALETGLLTAILPPIAAMASDLWRRTLGVLDALPDSPSVPLAFAALWHGVGSGVASSLARGLKLANAEREGIAWLVEHHRSLDDATSLRPSALKRLLVSEGVADLLALHRARALASTGDLTQIEFCERYLRDQPDGPIDPPPLVNGHDLARAGLRPGREFAVVLARVRDAQLDGEIATQEEAIELVGRLMNRSEGELRSP